MPNKGDDLEASVVNAGIEHLKNVTAVYTPKGYPHPSNASVNVDGILKRIYDENGNVSTKESILICRESDLTGEIEDGKITAKSVDYTIRVAMPNGRGKMELSLRKV